MAPRMVNMSGRPANPWRSMAAGAIQQGETFTPTEEIIAAFRDLMVPVGESLRTAAPEAAPEPEHPGSAARSPARGRREE